MTARQPFTRLCQQLAARRSDSRVDLHIHTTSSDGAYTPAEVVDLARRSGLSALAITDHDTNAATSAARAAAGVALEVISGVEISAEFHGKEFHLLGYFFDENEAALQAALERLREHRRQRFTEMLARLQQKGVRLDAGHLLQNAAPGRLHVARLLVQHRYAGTVRDAFMRYLSGSNAVPKVRLPVAEAITLVRNAGGVTAWAHPGTDCTRENLVELRGLGLQAVEADYPAHRPSRVKQIRVLAQALGLFTSGGSDCHGPGVHRTIGSHGVTAGELDCLRRLSRNSMVACPATS